MFSNYELSVDIANAWQRSSRYVKEVEAIWGKIDDIKIAAWFLLYSSFVSLLALDCTNLDH